MDKNYIRMFYTDTVNEEHTLQTCQHENPSITIFVKHFIHIYKNFKRDEPLQAIPTDAKIYLEMVLDTEITAELFEDVPTELLNEFSSITGTLNGEICVLL